MAPTPPNVPNPALARFPAEVLEAYQRYRAHGDEGAVEAVVIAAVVDYRPSSEGPPPSVSDQTRLVEDLGYDSVAIAELIFFFEDLFDLTISNDDIVGARTLADLSACVIRKLAGKKKSP